MLMHKWGRRLSHFLIVVSFALFHRSVISNACMQGVAFFLEFPLLAVASTFFLGGGMVALLSFVFVMS